MYWRYFSFIQNAYQNWVFDQWFTADSWEWMRSDPGRFGIEDQPWAKATDAGLPATAAAKEGFQFLQEVLTAPEPGAYMYDYDEGYYWAFDTSPVAMCTDEPAYYSDEWCADANLGLGDGRYLYSIYDWESGYYFYERLKWVGTFYDKLLALETLTNPDTFFLGVDTFQSADEWAISMYTSFPFEIQRLFGGIASDRFDIYAGVFDAAGTYLARDPFAQGKDAQVWKENGPVDPATSFTIQLYTLWYGMAWLNANFDNTFNDAAKIWLKGSAEAITPTDPDQLVEFENPFNQRTYVALRPTDPKLFGVGALMLDKAREHAAAMAAALADPATTADELDYYAYLVRNVVENIEVVRGMYDLYGYLYF